MTPNQITALRIVLAFAAVSLFGTDTRWNLAAVALTAAAVASDALDGYVARRRGMESAIGAQFDILGDRVIENLFFTYFAVTGLVTLWVPVLFFLRGALTDFLRGLAGRAGRSGFGRNSMIETRWGRAVVASRASRAAYGALKCVCFCWLGAELLVRQDAWATQSLAGWSGAMGIAGQGLVILTVAFCLLRAVPVIWDGKKYLAGPAQAACGAHAAEGAAR